MQLDLPKFEAANAQVLGISVDFNDANKAFAEKLGLKYPLLSDTRRAMTSAYGVLRDDPAAAKDAKRIAGYLRAIPTIMVVDKQGTIRYIRDNSSERNTIPMDEVLAAVEKAK